MSKSIEWNKEYGTGGVMTVKCDHCGKEVDFKFSKSPTREVYIGVNEKIKKKGWLIRKIGDDWYEFCSDECFDEF